MPDARYDWLCGLWKPPSEYPAYLHVTDIAGLVKGAAEGAGLGNAFLSHIQARGGQFFVLLLSPSLVCALFFSRLGQAVDGVFHVVRAFDSDEVVHGTWLEQEALR